MALHNLIRLCMNSYDDNSDNGDNDEKDDKAPILAKDGRKPLYKAAGPSPRT